MLRCASVYFSLCLAYFLLYLAHVVVSLFDINVVVYLLLSIYTFTETFQAHSTALLQTDSHFKVVVVYVFDVNVVDYLLL